MKLRQRNDDLYLYDIFTSLDLIQKYTQGLSENDFASNTMLQDAIIRRLQIIGEAAKKISDQTLKQYPDIPWAKIKGMRNRLVHNYDGVDMHIVWNTITESVPELKSLLEPFFKYSK